MTQPTYEAEVEALRQAQLAEYGKYVARDVIFVNGARAYNPGDPVPVSVVESGAVSKDAVVGANTKTAATISEKG